MARDAAFLHRVVLESKRTLLRGVAARARIVGAFERGALALDHVTLVRVVAVTASHLAREHAVAVGEAELAALFEMALEARLGRLRGLTIVPLLPPAFT